MEYKIQQFEEHEWCFIDPECVANSWEKFNEATEALNFGSASEAEDMIRAILKNCPIHIDALHHLALILEHRGLAIEAYLLEKEAVSIGMQALGQDFDFKQERLLWGHLDNRPFLRAYHGYGLQLLKRNGKKQARDIFENILATNPNDNQGIRCILPALFFDVNKPDRVIGISDRFPDDSMPETVYGRVLALVQLDRVLEAEVVLARAVASLPLVAHELLKERHIKPQSAFPGTVTLGGPDQAYEYWSDYGKYWRKAPKALELLRAALYARKKAH